MESVKELEVLKDSNIRHISYKNYFNDYMKLKEYINSYLLSEDDYLGERSSSFKKLEHNYLKYIISGKFQKPIDKIKAKQFNYFESNRSLDEIEFEIQQATVRLEKLSDFDISEEIWNYSKKILRNIYNQYLFRYNFKIPTPKIIFIEDSIEIDWESDSFKLILRISDFIQDISVYSRDKTGPPMHGNIRRERIIDWVVFWLEQFLNS